jgi:hypothetical protein
MRKKGELTLNYIILMIIAVVVLISVLIIFNKQIVAFVSNIQGTSDSLGTQLVDATESLGQ